MINQSIALKIASNYLKAVRATGVNVRSAYLFGSYALNRQHEWSDIDIALIADDFIGVPAFDKDRFRRLHLIPEFVVIETHTFPTSLIAEGDPFIKEIMRTGIKIN